MMIPMVRTLILSNVMLPLGQGVSNSMWMHVICDILLFGFASVAFLASCIHPADVDGAGVFSQGAGVDHRLHCWCARPEHNKSVKVTAAQRVTALNALFCTCTPALHDHITCRDDLYPFTCRSHANQPGQHLKILCFPAEVAKLGPEVAANSLPCNALTDCTLLLWAAFWVWGSWGHVEIVWIRTGGPLICMWYGMFIIVWEHVWYCIHFTGTKNLALALEFGSSLYISIYFDMDTNPLFCAKLKKTPTIAGWCGLWHHFQGWLNTPVESPTIRVVDEGLLNADVSEPDVCFGGCISVIGRSYQILVVPFCLSNASMMPWRQGRSHRALFSVKKKQQVCHGTFLVPKMSAVIIWCKWQI